MQLGSTTPSAHKVHGSRINTTHTHSAQQGSTTPNTHRVHVARMNNTRCTQRVHNKDQQHLTHIERMQHGSKAPTI
jgi:hypothetical protein